MIKKFLSIMLIIAMLFPLAINAVMADEEEVKENVEKWLSNVGNGLQLVSYYTTTEDETTGEKTEQWSGNFLKLPNGDTSFSGSGIKNNNGTLKYYDDATGKFYNVSLKVSSDSENMYLGDKLTITKDNDQLLTLNGISGQLGEPITNNPLNALNGKDLKIEVTVTDDNGNAITSDYTKPITSSQIPARKDITSSESWFDNVIGWLLTPIKQALRILEEVLTGLLLSLGDGILVQLGNTVGEPVTMDRVIFGDVQKLSIDFWGSGSGYMAATMRDTIEKWYNTFTAIAATVYMTILLVIGLKILYSSTGSGSGKYKMLLVDWVIGVAMLFLFPFVMKVTTEVNLGLVEALRPQPFGDTIKPVEESKILGFFGTNDFVTEMTGSAGMPDKNNSMMYIRYLAGKQGRIPLAIVYLIMIFQLIIILFVYYKRAFMVAFLIVIFPIVAITYILDKLRWGSNKNAGIQPLAKRVFTKCFYAVFPRGSLRSYSTSRNCIIYGEW